MRFKCSQKPRPPYISLFAYFHRVFHFTFPMSFFPHCSFLSLTPDDLTTVVSGSKYILDQACFFNLAAEKLHNQLVEHNMNEDQAAIFGKVWKKSRTPMVEMLREHSFGAPLALTNIDWRLQVSMAHDKLSKTKHVATVLDLHLADPSGETPAESVLLEFNKEQLLELYENLELIQSQVDKITK